MLSNAQIGALELTGTYYTHLMPKLSTDEIYAQVTERMLAALEKGTVPWQKPWTGGYAFPRNLSGRPYRGINALLLSLSGYGDPRWMTFNQLRKLDGVDLRKGEKATLVVLWKLFKVEDDEGEEKTVPMLRHFFVFNVEQCELAKDAEIKPWPKPAERQFNPIEAAEAIFDGWEDSGDAPEARFNGSRAAYNAKRDEIIMPARNSFKTPSGFYSTLWHECIHATGHPARLARYEASRYASEAYSREELVAEMGTAFIAGFAGLEGEFDNSAAYIKSWLRALKDDPKMVVWAAGRAQKAADRILRIENGGAEIES